MEKRYKQTYTIRLNPDIHDFLKTKGDMSCIIEDSLKIAGFYPSIDNIVLAIETKKKEVEQLRVSLKERIKIEFWEKFNAQVMCKYNDYKKKTNYPISKNKFYEKFKSNNKDNINSKIKKEVEKYAKI